MNFTKNPLLIAAITTFIGCTAQPRYQTLFQYEPPTDPAALLCLQGCEKKLESCTNNCSATYTACVRSIEPEVRSQYADAQKRYEGAWTQYQRDQENYRLSLSIGYVNSGGWYGQGWYDPWWPGVYQPYYYPPQPPVPPSYIDELSKLSAQMCNRDCACQPNYDACFLGCGGKKVLEQRCIVNCAPEK